MKINSVNMAAFVFLPMVLWCWLSGRVDGWTAALLIGTQCNLTLHFK